MSRITYTSALFLAVLSILFIDVKCEQEEALKEIDHIFDEIEQDHDKLKKVFKEIVYKETEDPEDRLCKCVPFYLCKAEDGTIIKDGEGLLRMRGGPEDEADDNPCEDPQDVCCMPPDLKFSPKILSDDPKQQCGYGTATISSSSNNNQSFAQFGEYPWTVMIANFQEGLGEYKCVGSLIHPQVVLTAAHCVDKTATIVLRAGELNRNERSEPIPHQNRFVKDIIKHPKFKLANLKFNVALLITEKPFILNEGINTACLPSILPNARDDMGHECVASGWGVDKPDGSFSAVMRKIRFLLIDNQHCQSHFRSTRLGELFELHKSFLCAFNKYGSDTCEGNGGGPLMCPVLNQPGRYQQVGITSWGIGCAGNKASVFTNIPEIKNWIDEQFDDLGFSKNFYTFEPKEGRS